MNPKDFFLLAPESSPAGHTHTHAAEALTERDRGRGVAGRNSSWGWKEHHRFAGSTHTVAGRHEGTPHCHLVVSTGIFQAAAS